jgi:hypothetical protein
MHSHSREAGFTQLWWIQGTISATLTAVRVHKTTRREPLQWGFMVEHLYPNSIPWFIRVYGSCQANRDSLSYLVIDF